MKKEIVACESPLPLFLLIARLSTFLREPGNSVLYPYLLMFPVLLQLLKNWTNQHTSHGCLFFFRTTGTYSEIISSFSNRMKKYR